MLTEKEIWIRIVHFNWDRWVDYFDYRDGFNEAIAFVLDVDVGDIINRVNRARDAASSSQSKKKELKQ